MLVENSTFDKKFYVGRSYMDIPDTDGMVIIKPISDFLIIQALLLFSFIRSPCSFAYDKPWAAFSLHVNLSDILSNNAQRE